MRARRVEGREGRVPGSKRELYDAARQLRTKEKATEPELLLWDELRHRRLGGLKFRRQQVLGPFVVDFFCAEARLVVELDGTVHDDPEEAMQDIARSSILQEHGFAVLRLRNDEVLNDLLAALRRIEAACRSRRCSPLPVRGRGAGGEG